MSIWGSPVARKFASGALAIALLILAGTALERNHAATLEQATAGVTSARAIAKAALAQSEISRGISAGYLLDAIRAEARADSLQKQGSTLRVKYVAAAKSSPIACDTVVLYADSALAVADSVNSELRKASVSLKTSLDSTTGANRLLTAALVNLDAKAGVLVSAARPSLLSRLVPKPGFGIAAGVNAAGQPQLVVGVTLGWSR